MHERLKGSVGLLLGDSRFQPSEYTNPAGPAVGKESRARRHHLGRHHQGDEDLRGIPELVSLGYPVLVGPSRKTFIGKLLDAGPEERLEGSVAAAVAAALAGANILRVHDVREAARAIKVADAIRFGAGENAGEKRA